MVTAMDRLDCFHPSIGTLESIDAIVEGIDAESTYAAITVLCSGGNAIPARAFARDIGEVKCLESLIGITLALYPDVDGWRVVPPFRCH